MIKIFINGITGKMGKTLIECAAENDDYLIVGGFSKEGYSSLPTYHRIKDVDVLFDVIIDFSNPSSVNNLINLALASKKPVIIATTGYSTEQQQKINCLSEIVPVFQSANMSYGINILANMVKAIVTSITNDYDIEIIEKHHNRKKDSPSGTAVMLADIMEHNGDYKPVYGRTPKSPPRQKKEIGIHSVRGGNIVGEHEILLCGNDEIISIKHTALSRKIFANGALKAAKFILNKPTGMYHTIE